MRAEVCGSDQVAEMRMTDELLTGSTFTFESRARLLVCRFNCLMTWPATGASVMSSAYVSLD